MHVAMPITFCSKGAVTIAKSSKSKSSIGSKSKKSDVSKGSAKSSASKNSKGSANSSASKKSKHSKHSGSGMAEVCNTVLVEAEVGGGEEESDSTSCSQSNDIDSHGRSGDNDSRSDDAGSESGTKISMIKKQRSSEKLSLMLTACSRGDIHRVKAAIKCGEVDINSTDSMDRTGASRFHLMLHVQCTSQCVLQRVLQRVL